MSQEFSRRSVLMAGAAAAVTAVVVPTVGGTATASAATGDGRPWQPAAGYRPRFRYWWPGADVTPGQVTAEVNAIADAGFGGIEIGDVRNSEHEAMPVARYGWGTPAWQAGLAAALRTAQARGLSVDIYIGPYWPAVAAGILPDDDSAMQELTYGQAIVTGTFAGAVPPPHSQPSGVRAGFPAVTVTPILQAVHAARIAGSTTATPLVVEQATLTDITEHVTAGTLTWAPPSAGSWVIIASYSRGTAMIEHQAYYEGWYYDFTAPRSYVVDHFGAAGGNAVVRWWENDLLTPQTRALFRATGGSIFEDSLEFVTELHWTPNMTGEFRSRRGYPLTPYLPLVHGQTAPVYVVEDASVGQRIRWDYNQTLSDLFIANHITLLDDWATSLGMRFRNQAYGAPLDSALCAASTGVPEGETLGFSGNPDSFRVLAAGRDLGRRTNILSCEMGAVLNGAYRQTIASEVMLANNAYALGVNQVRIHGFPYASSPTGQWPGFNPWAPLAAPINFGDAWGPRQPQWLCSADWAGYQARVHQVLQSGVNKVDIAVYREGFDSTSVADQFDGTALSDAGYSYHLLNWGLLGLPSAKVSGHRLAAGGPGYQALVIANQATMLLDSARHILDYARAGLPIVIIGELPATPTSFGTDDSELAALLTQLTATSGVTRIATPGELPAALAASGVTGSAVPNGITGLLHARRAGDVTYYFLYNSGATAVSGTVTLAGDGRPCTVDPWTGAITHLGRYTVPGRDRVTVPISAAAGEAVIIALAGDGERHAVSADIPVIRTDDGLFARITSPGTYSAVLDNGRTVEAHAATVPAVPTIGSWDVTIEDWQPADPGGVESDAIGTAKLRHHLTLATLVSWQQIPGMANVSGVGTYTATIMLQAATSAYLSLGSVGAGSARVTVNGTDIGPVNQVDPVVDLGRTLKAGANVITVTVATTLQNRLRATRPDVYTQPAQDYGLIGPVTITPYVDAKLT